MAITNNSNNEVRPRALSGEYLSLKEKMKLSKCLIVMLFVVAKPAFAQKTAITHVTIVNVTGSTLDTDQTVLIDSNRITRIGPSNKINIPAGATILDGTGRYLMPGMTDAHIHFFQSGGLYTRPDALNLNKVFAYEKDQQFVHSNLNNTMARYLAAGITTVIDVGGPLSNYQVRNDQAQNPKAPDAWVTGPLISTYLPPNLDKKDPPIIKVSSPEEAREQVRRQLPHHPDFIKIWYIVLPNSPALATLPIIKAAIDESHSHGLKVAVHATQKETAKLAVENGADILVHSVDDTLMEPDMLRLLQSRKTVYIPTLLVAGRYNQTFTQQLDLGTHELALADPMMLGTLLDLRHLKKTDLPFDYKMMRNRMKVPSRQDTIMAENLLLASKQGLRIVAGTDAGNIGTSHAGSFHAELLAMQKAGLSNWEIIRSATILPAIGFGKEKDFGSITVGKLANMILLDANPVADLNALLQLNRVIHHGNNFDPAQLTPVTPELLAQQQLNAYNLRNIDAFLEPYAEDVEIYTFPNQLLSKGKAAMRKNYTGMFAEITELHCELVNRIVLGNTVIDQERVTGFGGEPIQAIAIYKIENNKIAKVYFTR